MYGGGFATVPAYLRDMFGTRYVGAIHGLLITAWSAAGVLGPVLVNYIRQYQIDSGVPKAQAYNVTMYIMAALLVVGFICNFLIKAVDDRHHMNRKPPTTRSAWAEESEHGPDKKTAARHLQTRARLGLRRRSPDMGHLRHAAQMRSSCSSSCIGF